MMDRGEEDGGLYAKPKTAKMLSKRVGSMPSLHMLPQHSALIADSSSPMHSPASVLMLPSPDHSSSTSDGVISRYASEINLRDLDESDDNDNKERNDQDDEGGDKMIDRKAEDFIARFYEQMRIQNHNEMIRRQGKHYRRHRHSSHELYDGWICQRLCSKSLQEEEGFESWLLEEHMNGANALISSHLHNSVYLH